MNIERDQNGTFLFSDVESPLAELFLAIPYAAEPENNQAAMNRLFQPPTIMETKVNEEWAELVHPELRELFENATTTVEVDLDPLKTGEKGWAIPLNHVDAWLNALNQARLALAAKFDVTDEDMNHAGPFPQDNERGIAISQIHVYGLLQEYLIQGTEGS